VAQRFARSPSGGANHPQVVLRRWRKATGQVKAPRGRRARPRVTIGKIAKNGRTISWPQELVRRAVYAMREAHTNDLYVLAARGLNAAIKTEADVALLIAPPKASTAAVFAAPQSFPEINRPVR
jgi:hypothetical protein